MRPEAETGAGLKRKDETMRFLTLLALLMLAACNNSEPGRDDTVPLHLPEIY